MKPGPEKRFGAPTFPVSALHITVLFSLTVSQPLFNLISRNTEFLVARQSEAIDIAVLIVLLSAIVPLIFIVIEGLAQLIYQKVRIAVHFLFVSSLFAALVLQAIIPIFTVQGYVILAGAGLIGIVAATAYYRYPAIRLFFTILSPSILIFPMLFIFNSPVQRLLFVKPDTESVRAPSIEIAEAPPIVMVVFDELPVTSLMTREKGIDSSRYPNFAALARDAYWFRNATTVSTTTADAVPAILSGLYPKRPRLPNADGYPNNLFTLLGGAYTIKADEPVTRLCPRNLCKPETEPFLVRMQSLITDLSVVYLHILLPRDLTSTLPVVTRTWKDFMTPDGFGKEDKHWTEIRKTSSRRRILLDTIHEALKKDRGERFRKFVDQIEDTGEPRLYFCHSYLPHTPWIFLPSGKRYVLPGYGLKGLSEGGWEDSFSGAQAFQRHLLQLGFVDTLLGELTAKLKQYGLYNRSLIVITADHGVSFRSEDMRRGLTQTNYPDIMPVPLLIKLPDQHKSVIDDKSVEAIDILPTIADALNITLPFRVDGRSAFEDALQQRDQKVIYTVFRNTPEHKYVFGPDGNAKYKTVQRKYDLFGEGADDGNLYTIGPHSGLIGKKPGLDRMTEAPGATATIDNEDLYERITLNAPFIPAHITGQLDMGKDVGVQKIAVSVNGVVSAVTQTFHDPTGEIVFSAVVPESSFRSGRNQIDVFIIGETEKGIALSRVSRSERIAFSLSKSNRLTSSRGDTIKIVGNTIRGALNRLKVHNDNVSLIGWAAGKEKSNYPDIIAVFVNDRFFYSGVINRNRPDVVEYFNDKSLLRSGFHFNFSSGLFVDNATVHFRIFGISKSGVASELAYPNGSALTLD